MAVFILSKAAFMLGSTDLSSRIKTVTFSLTSDAPDITSMGDDWRDFLAGLKEASITLDFYQDLVSSNVDVDNTLWTAFTGTNRTEFKLMPVRAATAMASKPMFSGYVQITNYDPVTGTVGDVAMAPVTLKCLGTVARAVTSSTGFSS